MTATLARDADLGIIPILDIRRRLGRDRWGAPHHPPGLAVWRLITRLGHGRPQSVIVSAGIYTDGSTWLHASIAGFGTDLPDWDDLTRLHAAVWPDGHAYQCFVPRDEHVNLHPSALHLWGRADGRPLLPDFGAWGTI